MDNDLKFTVSELTQCIKDTLETSFFGLSVEGEVSDFKISTAGHWFFSLKDNDSLVSATIWSSIASKISFVPKNGQKVIVRGNITVYKPRGTYSLMCTSMRLSGEGDILLMLEKRKKSYESLGWFESSLKKNIPIRPSRLAVITSASGAALHDILQVTKRRNPSLDILILPAQVQGQGAAEEIALRIRQVNKYNLAPVMIVGRGGGSFEDLLPFSEDCVIKAIHESVVPVISAVGHETDWAISDFVADLRAPTPSAAAELVCKSSNEIFEKTKTVKKNMFQILCNRLSSAKLSFNSLSVKTITVLVQNKIGTQHLKTDSICTGVSEFCMNKIRALRSKINSMTVKNEDELKLKLLSYRKKFEICNEIVKAVNPSAVLKRGFAIVSTQSGHTVSSIGGVCVGTVVGIRVSDGKIEAKVKEIKNEV